MVAGPPVTERAMADLEPIPADLSPVYNFYAFVEGSAKPRLAIYLRTVWEDARHGRISAGASGGHPRHAQSYLDGHSFG